MTARWIWTSEVSQEKSPRKNSNHGHHHLRSANFWATRTSSHTSLHSFSPPPGFVHPNTNPNKKLTFKLWFGSPFWSQGDSGRGNHPIFQVPFQKFPRECVYYNLSCWETCDSSGNHQEIAVNQSYIIRKLNNVTSLAVEISTPFPLGSPFSTQTLDDQWLFLQKDV